MPDIVVYAPQQLTNPGEAGPPPLEQFTLTFLAQGDSWFSIGAIPPWLTSNLFDRMSLGKSACAVNCARPGKVLSHMADTMRDRVFLNLLSGNIARAWSGLLVSGGGNDVIDAAQVPPQFDANERLLATQPEWGDASLGGERYLSNAGWTTFSTHLRAVFADLVAARDRAGGPNVGIPLFLHTYDVATPRNAGAGGGFGPWLYPAVRAFGVPEADWPALARALLARLRTLLMAFAVDPAFPNVAVIDTQGTLDPALTTDNHDTADWRNEIHPTRRGYQKLANRWEAVLDAHYGP